MHNAGEPMIIKKAVCMHEEDYGTLWKHTEYRTGHSEVRRSRRLVLSFISTIANYEYGFYWYFYQVWPHPSSCTSACADFWYACCPGAIAEPLADLRSSNPCPFTLHIWGLELQPALSLLLHLLHMWLYQSSTMQLAATCSELNISGDLLCVCVCVCVCVCEAYNAMFHVGWQHSV